MENPRGFHVHGCVLEVRIATADSSLRIEQFFDSLYLWYDERYVYAAPDLKHMTSRIEWSPQSPALALPEAAGAPKGLHRQDPSLKGDFGQISAVLNA